MMVLGESLFTTSTHCVTVTVAAEKVGRIIGVHGSTINSLRTTTGASIDLDKTHDGLGRITILGEKANVDSAQTMIEALLRDGVTSQKSSTICEEVVEVASKLIGKVIGAAGSTIRGLRVASGAKISIEKKLNGDGDIRLTGTAEQVRLAKENIESLLFDDLVDFHTERLTTITIDIPHKYVGKIIGHKGSVIEMLRMDTGARIDVNNGANGDEEATIIAVGNQKALSMLKEAIKDIMIEFDESSNERYNSSMSHSFGVRSDEHALDTSHASHSSQTSHMSQSSNSSHTPSHSTRQPSHSDSHFPSLPPPSSHYQHVQSTHTPHMASRSFSNPLPVIATHSKHASCSPSSHLHSQRTSHSPSSCLQSQRTSHSPSSPLHSHSSHPHSFSSSSPRFHQSADATASTESTAILAIPGAGLVSFKGDREAVEYAHQAVIELLQSGEVDSESCMSIPELWVTVERMDLGEFGGVNIFGLQAGVRIAVATVNHKWSKRHPLASNTVEQTLSLVRTERSSKSTSEETQQLQERVKILELENSQLSRKVEELEANLCQKTSSQQDLKTKDEAHLKASTCQHQNMTSSNQKDLFRHDEVKVALQWCDASQHTTTNWGSTPAESFVATHPKTTLVANGV